jgi:AIR synthase-related protein
VKLEPTELGRLALELGARVELEQKRDIQIVANAFGRKTRARWLPVDTEIMNGDDAAAIRAPDGGFVLVAAEGMQNEFVAADPWFAGYSALMVNVSDIAAMGGRPWAVVDVLFLGSGHNQRVLDGLRAASATFGVPIVGGHTTRVEGATSLAVAIVGHANRLIESHTARPGQVLLAAIDLRGSFRGRRAFNAATTLAPERLRAQLALLPELSEAGLVCAGKDISNAGVCGTLAMLLESSGRGAWLDLERLPAPEHVDPLRWLTAFPSFGFLLTAEPDDAARVCQRFEALGVTCREVGAIRSEPALELVYSGASAHFGGERGLALTGFGPRARVGVCA